MAKVELNQGKAVEAVKKKTEKAESSIRRSNNRQVSLTSKGGQHWFCDTAGSLCIRWCITRSGHLFIYSSEPRDLDYIVKTFLDPADTLVRMDSPCGGVIKSKYVRAAGGGLAKRARRRCCQRVRSPAPALPLSRSCASALPLLRLALLLLRVRSPAPALPLSRSCASFVVAPTTPPPQLTAAGTAPTPARTTTTRCSPSPSRSPR
jgi:hypothetical protein